MGYVGEGAAVDKGGRPFKGLHKIRLKSVLKKCGHCAVSLQISGGDGLLVIGVAHNNAGKTFLKVHDIIAQAENRHNLAGHGDVIAVLAGNTVDPSSQPVNHVAQLPVVHVHTAAPGYALGVNIQAVALINMVIQHCRQQVVGGAYCVEIAGKVEIYILHWHDLSISAAGRTALNSKNGAKGRLTEGYHCSFTDFSQAVSQTYRSGGFALSCGGGSNGRYKDKLAIGLVRQFIKQFKVNFCLVISVLLKVFFINTGYFCNFTDVCQFSFLCDLDICFELHCFVPFLAYLSLLIPDMSRMSATSSYLLRAKM